MTKKVILHIGRHKTGTSSLQKSLSENTELLKKNGFVYPTENFCQGYGHHKLANALCRGNTKNKSNFELKELLEGLSRVLSNIEVGQSETLVLSSEAFQNCDPKLIRQFFDDSEFEVNVVCYLREQIGYIASAYNQKVHATEYHQSVDTFYADFNADYTDFVENWVKFFPSSRFRVFDKVFLENGDILDDFWRCILNVHDNFEFDGNSNLSLTNKFLVFKQRFNATDIGRITQNKYRSLYQMLAQKSINDDSGKFSLSSNMSNEIEKIVSISNSYISEKYIENGELVLKKTSHHDGLYELSILEYERIKVDLFTKLGAYYE